MTSLFPNDCSLQFYEMRNKILEILTVVDVETMPQVAAHHYAAKAQVGHLIDVLEADAAKGIDVTVNKSLTRGCG